MVEAAKKARIHTDIEKLPNGYNTKVGERGVKLSAGQRQRVSIARAFLKNMPILILDEPTSSLDVETEQHLKDSLKELTKGKTTFIISHRLTLIENTDKIITLKDGQIFQAGTHTELADQCGPDHKIAVSPLTI